MESDIYNQNKFKTFYAGLSDKNSSPGNSFLLLNIISPFFFFFFSFPNSCSCSCSFFLGLILLLVLSFLTALYIIAFFHSEFHFVLTETLRRLNNPLMSFRYPAESTEMKKISQIIHSSPGICLCQHLRLFGTELYDKNYTKNRPANSGNLITNVR